MGFLRTKVLPSRASLAAGKVPSVWGHRAWWREIPMENESSALCSALVSVRKKKKRNPRRPAINSGDWAAFCYWSRSLRFAKV